MGQYAAFDYCAGLCPVPTQLPMRSLKVLILEDNPFQLMALHQMLNANGVFNVLTAENVETARQSLESTGQVDIAICDLYLEKGDGLELIRELAERRLAQVLILLSNAEPDVLEGVANMARQLGLNVLACLPKPASAKLIGQVLTDCQARLRPGPPVMSWERVRQLLSLSDREPLPPSAGVSQASIARCGRVWYQPIVNQAGVLQGVEALARWQLSEPQLLLPDDFLPVLEFAGMEEAFTWHVLEQALGLAGEVMDETGQVLPVAVNIPGRMLERSHFPQVLQGLLQLHGVPAQSLTLELVETSRLKTDSAHVTGLLRLRMMGGQLSIGDFGVGGTSLQRLLELPFTELKIPPAFACGMASDDRKAAVVAGAMSMAARLDVAVVVTGVESAADYHAVGELGAAWLQGCFIARPMDAEALKQWIAFQARPARVPAYK